MKSVRLPPEISQQIYKKNEWVNEIQIKKKVRDRLLSTNLIFIMWASMNGQSTITTNVKKPLLAYNETISRLEVNIFIEMREIILFFFFFFYFTHEQNESKQFRYIFDVEKIGEK